MKPGETRVETNADGSVTIVLATGPTICSWSCWNCGRWNRRKSSRASAMCVYCDASERDPNEKPIICGPATFVTPTWHGGAFEWKEKQP